MTIKMGSEGTMWFGDIPAYWEIRQIGNLYNERKTKVSDKDYPPLSVTMQGILPQLETAAKTDAHDDRKLIKKGDFVINSRSDRRGSCGISPSDGSCSLINTVLEPRGEMNPEYYNWFFHTVRFGEEFYRWGHGIHDDLWTTNYSEMKRIFIPVPPIAEQITIAKFLNNKCAAIDEAIERHKKVVEKLEEYRCSIISDYITRIPGEKTRVKFVGSVQTGPFGTQLSASEYVEEGIPCINVKNIKNGYISEENVDKVPFSVIQRLPAHVLRTGDIVFARKGSIDKHAIVSGHENGWLQGSDCIRLRLKEAFDPDYINYNLSSQYVKDYLITVANGSTMPSLNSDMIKELPVIIHSIDEQKRIVAELHDATKKIDQAIQKNVVIVEKLQEYRKSLIYHAVTGKICC